MKRTIFQFPIFSCQKAIFLISKSPIRGLSHLQTGYKLSCEAVTSSLGWSSKWDFFGVVGSWECSCVFFLVVKPVSKTTHDSMVNISSVTNLFMLIPQMARLVVLPALPSGKRSLWTVTELWKVTMFNCKSTNIHYKWPFSTISYVRLPEGIYIFDQQSYSIGWQFVCLQSMDILDI